MTDNQPPPTEPTDDNGGTPTEQVDVTRDELVEDPQKLLNLYEKRKHEAKSLRDRLASLEAELEQTRQANLTETEQMIERAVKERATEVELHYNSLLTAERLKNRAANKLNDPEDAVRLLDPSEFDVDDYVSMDEAIDELIKAKPYLARKQQVPSADQGPQGDGVAGGREETFNDWIRKAAGNR